MRTGSRYTGILAAQTHALCSCRSVADERRLCSHLKSNDEAADLIVQAITKEATGRRDDISICLDPASSEMWDDGKYVFFKSTKKA